MWILSQIINIIELIQSLTVPYILVQKCLKLEIQIFTVIIVRNQICVRSGSGLWWIVQRLFKAPGFQWILRMHQIWFDNALDYPEGPLRSTSRTIGAALNNLWDPPKPTSSKTRYIIYNIKYAQKIAEFFFCYI